VAIELSRAASVRGWAACRHALTGSELVSDPESAGRQPAQRNNMLLMDGGLHQAVRKLVQPFLTLPHLHQVHREIDELADTLVPRVLRDPAPDLVRDLAEPLVLAGILGAMRAAPARRAELARAARDMTGLLEPDLSAQDKRRTGRAAMRAAMLFEQDGAAGTAAGLHAVLEQAAREGTIPVKLARTTPVVVLHGGYENPVNQLGCLIAWAVAHPGSFRRAAAQAPGALFEEIMRVYSPVRAVARWAAVDDEAGSSFKRGDFVWIDLESANLDPGRFEAADRLDPTKRRAHLGLGLGRHACPGGTLARIEGQALIRALLTIPDELLAGFTVEWREGVVAHGPARISRR
jgi:cytochrome P450